MNISSTSTPGMNVGELFKSGVDNVAKRGEALQTKMNEMMSKGELNQEDMLSIQFEMGQYNALMESLSTVTKSLTDMLKNMAQRAG